jgi:RNA polymerase sigma factor (TIGR02999 family)
MPSSVFFETLFDKCTVCYNLGVFLLDLCQRINMATASPEEVTQLLLDLKSGDRTALDRLFPMVYEELRRLAHHYMRQERAGATLQTTALVNEAYLRLVDYKRMSWQSRAHFFAVAAQVMRRILVDQARSRDYAKRGGGTRKVSLDEAAIVSKGRSSEVIAVDDALKSLEAWDRRKAQIVEMRFFGGLSIEETAEVMNLSPTTVQREWRSAKAWLHRAISDGECLEA